MELNKDKYISTDELEEGLQNGIKIDKRTQDTLRSKRKLAYTKFGNRCFYKIEWILDYVNHNKVEAISKSNRDK